MIQVRPDEGFEAGASGFATGLGGTLGVQIVNTPAGGVVLARTTAGISENPAGSGYYTRSFSAAETPDTEGTYSIIWDDGTISPSTIAVEELHVSASPAFAPFGGPDLITLAEYKARIGETGTENDTKYQLAINDASQAVRDFTQRQWRPADAVYSTRRFIYDYSGTLEIDDAKEFNPTDPIKLVNAGVGDIVLTDDEWEAGPYQSDYEQPFYWVDFLGGHAGLRQSPEMGFARNMDTLWPKYLTQGHETFVDISAKWGWDAIPDSVKRAMVWAVASFVENPRNVVSEHVAGVGRTYSNPSRGIALPERSKDLLYVYQRMK